mgnify:CR=1 FL=1
MHKLLVAHLASDDGIFLIDVLQTEADLWLVPQWFDSEDGKYQTPARAIRLDFIAHQKSGIGGADITVNSTIPKSVLAGPDVSAGGTEYEVVTGISARFGWLAKRQLS